MHWPIIDWPITGA